METVKYRQVELLALNEENVKYVFEHLRDYDREELKLQSLNERNCTWLLKHQYAFCANYQGKPLSVFGVAVRKGALYFFFVATKEMDKNPKVWLTAHMLAKEFVPMLSAKFFGKRQLVEVWDKHTQSIKWLNKLGFKEDGWNRKVNGETLMIMERK